MYDIELVPIDKIRPSENNTRIHNTQQIKQIMESIKEFGFTSPLIIDSNYNLIAGHGRLEAVKQLNNLELIQSPITSLPSVRVKGLSDMQLRAYSITDNKLTECAGWDIELLQNELKELEAIGYDLSLTGFNDDELNNLLAQTIEDTDKEYFFDNKEYDVEDFNNDKVALSFNLSLNDFRMVNACLLSLDSDINKAIVKLVGLYDKA